MGAEAVIEKIRAKAETEAEAITAAGRAAADAQAAKVAEQTAAEKQRILDDAKAGADALKYRERLKAELDARKNTLEVKRGLLDSVFTTVREKLLALPAAEKEKLYDSLVSSCGMSGRVSVLASEDMRQLCEKRAAAWGFDFGGTVAGSGVLLLCGEKYDADLSADSIIAELRDSCESKAASILFE